MLPDSTLVDFDPTAPTFDLPYSVTAAELMTADLPPRELLVDPILPAKGLAMLYGPRGLGKTHVALGIAWAAASGGTFLKWNAKRAHRVLYVDGEMPAADMKERLRLIGSAPDTLRFMLADLQDEPMPDLGTPEGQARLERAWDEQPELLVIDNLSSLVSTSRDNDADGWSIMQSWLLKLRRMGISVLLVHHAGKGGQQRGTSRREDVLDIVLALRRPSDYEAKDGARFELHMEKARGVFGPATEPFEARLATDEAGRLAWSWIPVRDAAFSRAIDLFNDGISAADAAEALGISRATAFRLRKQARDQGLLTDEADSLTVSNPRD